MVCLTEVGNYICCSVFYYEQEMLRGQFVYFAITRFGQLSLPSEKGLTWLSCACSILRGVFLEELLT